MNEAQRAKRITPRTIARAAGLKTYHPGYPCSNGHDAERRVANGRCVECRKLDTEKEKLSPAWKARHQRHNDRYNADPANADKIGARNKVRKAVASGKLVKSPCQRCGTTEYVHGHHDDYGKPLEVMWLCPAHHKERHKELENGQR